MRCYSAVFDAQDLCDYLCDLSFFCFSFFLCSFCSDSLYPHTISLDFRLDPKFSMLGLSSFIMMYGEQYQLYVVLDACKSA